MRTQLHSRGITMKHSTWLILFAPFLLYGAENVAKDVPDQPVKVTPDMYRAAQDNNGFALDLYARLRVEPGNLFFSPYSISTALAMTYVGARTETAAQMAKTLHFTLDPKRLHPAFRDLMRLHQGGAKSGYKLN